MTPDVAELVRELGSGACRCGRPKRPRQTFCRSCYARLPSAHQTALYRRIGEGYEEAYAAAAALLDDRSFACPACLSPLHRETDPRAADRYVCRAPGCGRVWVIAEWDPTGQPVFL